MIQNLIYKSSILNYSTVKESIIAAIKSSKYLDNDSKTEKHFTDYHISTDIPRIYESLILGHIYNHMRSFQQDFNFNGINLHHMWFQWYPPGGFHDWHVHPLCHFTNVCYINLPDHQAKTEIKDINHNIISIDVKEGDILTFPAFLLHRSPISTQEKIIIAFNTNII